MARIELDAERAAAQARKDAEAAEGLVDSMRAAVALGTGDEAELQAAMEVCTHTLKLHAQATTVGSVEIAIHISMKWTSLYFC